MKDATLAPMYASLYAGLCDIARGHGYALAIHGSVQADLDLVAIPWIEKPTSPKELVKHFLKHLTACLGEGFDTNNPEMKPHGRLAYNLYLYHGSKVDLSIMPVQNAPMSLQGSERIQNER